LKTCYLEVAGINGEKIPQKDRRFRREGGVLRFTWDRITARIINSMGYRTDSGTFLKTNMAVCRTIWLKVESIAGTQPACRYSACTGTFCLSDAIFIRVSELWMTNNRIFPVITTRSLGYYFPSVEDSRYNTVFVYENFISCLAIRNILFLVNNIAITKVNPILRWICFNLLYEVIDIFKRI